MLVSDFDRPAAASGADAAYTFRAVRRAALNSETEETHIGSCYAPLEGRRAGPVQLPPDAKLCTGVLLCARGGGVGESIAEGADR